MLRSRNMACWRHVTWAVWAVCTAVAFGLQAGELTLARFSERGEFGAIRCGKNWLEMGCTILIPNKGWKSTVTLGQSAIEKKVVEGKTVWSGSLKFPEGAGFNVTQSVWEDDGRLVIDVQVKSLGADPIEGIYYSCSFPVKHWAGGHFKCSAVEGALPAELKVGQLLPSTSGAEPLVVTTPEGQSELTFTFSQGISIKLHDAREWKRDNFWLAICMQEGSLAAGHAAHLRMTIAPATIAAVPAEEKAQPVEDKAPPVASQPKEPQPIPEEKAQQEAEVLIRDFFKDGYAKTDPDARAALAKRLLREAHLTNTDLDLKFVMLREARTVALEGGHVDLALRALDATGAAFVFDAAKEKTALLAQLAKSAKTPDAAKNVAGACLDMAEELLKKNQFTEVRSLLSQVETAAKAVKDEDWQKETKRRLKDTQEALREYERVAASFQKLEATPDDPEANAAVGRFLCFTKGNWEQGLPLLGKGSDAVLKKLALADLAGPQDAAAQAELGDGWWQYGKSLPGKARFIAQDHAVQWLQKALPALDAARQEQIGKTLIAFYASAAEHGMTGGSFQLGNVALAKNGATLSRVGEGGALTPEPSLQLLDGVTTGYTGSTGFTYRSYPCAWVVTLPKTYVLQELRLLLWDGENRFYRYVLETSMDGKEYQLAADCSKGEWRSWQSIRFPPRLAKYIRLKGLYNNANVGFHVVELEAYCVPPATPVTPKYPSNPTGGGEEAKPERHKRD